MVANYQPKNGIDITEFQACMKADLEVERLMNENPYLTLHAQALANNNK